MDDALAPDEREGTVSPVLNPWQPPRQAAELEAALRDRLEKLRDLTDHDLLANPILLLSLSCLGRIREGPGQFKLFEELIQTLTVEAFVERAARLRQYWGETDAAANRRRLRELIRGLAHDSDGQLRSIETFRERVEKIHYGFVITAHPTFSLANALQQDLAQLATSDGTTSDLQALLEHVASLPHRPEQKLDLEEEHRQSLAAIDRLLGAVTELHGAVLEVARELYSDDWRSICPALVSIATWVGYDTDGRSDITWAKTFAMRIRVQVFQAQRYRRMIQRMRDKLGGDGPVLALLELIDARLALMMQTLEGQVRVFENHRSDSAEWLETLAEASKALVAGQGTRLAAKKELRGLIDRALAAADDDIAGDLWVMRSEIAVQGLIAARTHVRINATQLHNAIRKVIAMDRPPEDPTFRITYRDAISDLIDKVEPVSVNFGVLERERATARRVFMTMAQMLKFLDGDEPIRFLIAETESAFTLLTALYFAKLFGIERQIDISPLFETRPALETGLAILDDALAVPAYRDYVLNRGRLCIQTGYSDAGRYMGQVAACVIIERIRLGLAALLRKHDLDGVDLLIFDTHGESIGRGAHPGSLTDRLAYYDTIESRRVFRKAGIHLIEESSYQGGDGYLHFCAANSSLAVVTRVIEHLFEEQADDDDPFYEQAGYVSEFFAAVEQFNKRIIDDPCYAVFLGAFGANFLYATGSRSLKRQFDLTGVHVDLEHPSQIRAIPHNSILQQLGILANTIGGLGEAVDRDPGRFQALYRDSKRFRRLMTMIEHAFKFTDLEVVRAYLDLFDPAYWLKRAEASRDENEQDELRQISKYLERLALHDRLIKIHRIFSRDYLGLSRALREHRRSSRGAGQTPIAVDKRTRDNLHMMHAVRLALIQRMFRLAVRIPDFSHRHATSHNGLIMRIMHLEIPASLHILGEIFPLIEAADGHLDYGETSTYEEAEVQSYMFEHREIFTPIAEQYELIRRIGSGIVHHIGAVG